MATIYRFIVEQKTTTDGRAGNGRKSLGGKQKGASKGKIKTTTLLGSAKGGVEHNRYMRAVNPVLNKATGGLYEKGTRLGRAGLGLVKFNAETGAFAGLSGVAITIIISFILQTILQIQNKQRHEADKQNAHNFKMLENGVGSVHGQYEISVNMWNGRQTYNQNK